MICIISPGPLLCCLLGAQTLRHQYQSFSDRGEIDDRLQCLHGTNSFEE